MKLFKKLLITTDFSDLSLTGADHVCSLALQYDAVVYLMHVIDNTPPLGFPSIDVTSETALRDMERDAMDRLIAISARRFSGLRTVLKVIRRGEPWKEIVRFAVEEGIDIIIMTTHGRTGLAHVFLGSVAEKVMRHSPVPVLSVKPKQANGGGTMLRQEDVQEQLHIDARKKA